MPEGETFETYSPEKGNQHGLPEENGVNISAGDNRTPDNAGTEDLSKFSGARSEAVNDKLSTNGELLTEKETCELGLENGEKCGTEELPLIENHGENRRVNICSQNACSEKQACTGNAKTLDRATSCYDNAPDGGWGWVVTFAAFMVGVILDGISFSFGLFFKELLVHFNEGKSLTSWIISVLNGTYLGIGKYFH